MSKEQLLETLLKDAMKHLNDTLDKALNLEKDLEKANERIKKLRSSLIPLGFSEQNTNEVMRILREDDEMAK